MTDSTEEVGKVKGPDIAALLEDGRIIAALLSILIFFAPGVLYLFLFYRELFISLDVFKVLILAASVTTPIIFANFFIWGIYFFEIPQAQKSKSDLKKSDTFLVLLLGAFTSGLFSLTTLTSTYFFHLDMKKSVLVLFVQELLFLSLIVYTVIRAKSQKVYI